MRAFRADPPGNTLRHCAAQVLFQLQSKCPSERGHGSTADRVVLVLEGGRGGRCGFPNGKNRSFRFEFARSLVEPERTVLAAALTTVTPLSVIGFGENDVPFLAVIEILGLQFLGHGGKFTRFQPTQGPKCSFCAQHHAPLCHAGRTGKMGTGGTCWC